MGTYDRKARPTQRSRDTPLSLVNTHEPWVLTSSTLSKPRAASPSSSESPSGAGTRASSSSTSASACTSSGSRLVSKSRNSEKKAKENADELMAQKAELDKQVDTAQEAENKLAGEWKVKVGTIGNIVHSSVPTSTNEDENQGTKVA